MWQLPFLNLCFVAFLITHVAIQHSVSVFRPTESNYVLFTDDPVPSRTRVGFESASKTSPFRDGLGGAIDYLRDLWRRSIILREWTLERQTSYWGAIRAASGAETDLVEARFHVANAEVFDAAMGQKQRAKVELERAENYLFETQPLIVDKLRPALEKIRQELGAAKVDSESMFFEDSERYERIKSDLDHMIERVRFTKA
jgi:hypothetical protein